MEIGDGFVAGIAPLSSVWRSVFVRVITRGQLLPGEANALET